jgi:hypothetical protein
MNGGLTDADFQGCRWIHSDDTTPRLGLWCCRPTVPGSAYCPEHRAIAWNYRRGRRRPVSPALSRPAMPH